MKKNDHAESWAATERLRFVEKLAWWKGSVNRRDLRNAFGISQPQATIDLQRFQQINPGAMNYDLRRKQYESHAGMVCVLHRPSLDEAIDLLMNGSSLKPSGYGYGEGLFSDGDGYGSRGSMLDGVFCPRKPISEKVGRMLFLAVLRGAKLRILPTLRGEFGHAEWRVIAPHAFAHSGLGWHVRAWDFVQDRYADWAVGAIEDAQWPGESFVAEEPDREWNRTEEVILSPHPGLPDSIKLLIENTYDLESGRLTVKVRTALLPHLMTFLRVDSGSGRDRPHFVMLPKHQDFR